jgi:Tfp pilus assembly protein PilV
MRDEQGFTVVEIVVAVLVLMVGVTALVGTSALVTRQVGRGRIVTIANQMASQKLDSLRALGGQNRTGTGRCTATGFASGGPTTTRGVTLQWFVTGTGKSRTLQVNADYRVKGGTRTLTLTSIVGCL